MRLWLDDIRRPPDDSWLWARTNKDGILALLLGELHGDPCEEASLDHDLGEHLADPDDEEAWLRCGSSPDGDGADFVQAMIALRLAPPRITIHSWNHDGAARMAGMLDAHFPMCEIAVRPWDPDGRCPLCGSDEVLAWIEGAPRRRVCADCRLESVEQAEGPACPGS